MAHFRCRERIVPLEETSTPEGATGGGEFIETLPDGASLPPQLLEQAEQEQTVRDAMAHLSPRCQQFIRHLFFDQPTVPYAEIARRLGLATGSIGSIGALFEAAPGRPRRDGP